MVYWQSNNLIVLEKVTSIQCDDISTLIGKRGFMMRILQSMLCLALVATFFSFYGNTAWASASGGVTQVKRGQGEMTMVNTEKQERVALSAQKQKELFGKEGAPKAEQDSDLNDTMNRLIYGEIYQQGNLNDKQRELVTLAVLATNQNTDLINDHVGAALNAGATPVEIKEAMYQCAPYIGFPKTLAALQQVNAVFKKCGISLPVESQKQVTEANRLEEGIKVQKSIFGDAIDTMRANAPENQKQLQDYLSAYCFGDTYTRTGLDLKLRELLTFSVIASLGGCENQVKAHISGNISVGNDKETLISALTVCMPYIGFPRTLNALSCINQVLPEK